MDFLNLNEYLLAIEYVTHKPIDENERQGIAERCPFRCADDGMDAVEEPFADAEMAEYDGHEFAQYIEEQRVHAKNEEGYGHS